MVVGLKVNTRLPMERLPKAEAHDEALRMNTEIDEHEAKLRELKGTKESEEIEKEKTQEKLKMKSIELPDMVGKPLSEVYEYLKTTYGEERLAKIPDDINTLPSWMKDDKLYYFFNSVIRDQGDRVFVPGSNQVPLVYWSGGEWSRNAPSLDSIWLTHNRVMLLEE